MYNVQSELYAAKPNVQNIRPAGQKWSTQAFNLAREAQNFVYTHWHTINAVCWFPAEKLVNFTHLFINKNIFLLYKLQQLKMSKTSPFANSHRHVPLSI
jgi:hypothetical protein